YCWLNFVGSASVGNQIAVGTGQY
nr:hypothetical protein [Tanacetum cinerariifolium]